MVFFRTFSIDSLVIRFYLSLKPSRIMADYRLKLSDELTQSLVSEFMTYGDSKDNVNSANTSDISRHHQEVPGQQPVESSKSISAADGTCSGASFGRASTHPSPETASKISISSGYASPE
tara:strand:- start:168 stop:527 length:360 start_codon:yes stop_codon:yes gene_type:complete